MTIQVVFFDMGGTIETFWHTPALRLEATPGIQQILLNAGINLNLSNKELYEVVSGGLRCYNEVRNKTLDEYSASRVWSEFILAGYAFDPAKLAAIAETLMLYVETHYYRREMRPEMPAVLEAIRKMGLKIGLISNVMSQGQVPNNLAAYNIRHYFDPIVLSCEYGRRKPDPSIFHYAARLANVPTSACVYVGDRITRDILGARKAGFRLAIQIRHDFEHGEEDQGATPDAIIDHMTGLLEVLQVEIVHSNQKAALIAANQRKIRALLFDAGDILYFRPQRGRKFAAFLKELSHDIKEIHPAKKAELTDQAYQGAISQDQYREAIIRLCGVSQTEQIERGKQVLKEEDDSVQIFEGVQKTLLALKEKGVLLGIVTDTANPVHVKLRWFERAGFGHVWDSFVSSKELGIRKPDPGIFQAALQQVNLRPEQVAFVGHKVSELEGARAVGMHTIAFNYDEGAQADCYIEQFADLLTLSLVNQLELEAM